jgi:phosphonate transport system substrate-binding protein
MVLQLSTALRRTLAAIAILLPALLSGCGKDSSTSKPAFTISAIPDQDPERLQRLYGGVASFLSKELGVPVSYRPVTDYTASVTAFKVGELDMVWYGGLTGVQARLQVPGAHAVAQRDIDAQFHCVFIANKNTDINDLPGLKGHTFTFGSESSTSGRLMPQFFLGQAGIKLEDFKGKNGFSGSHDKTIKLVAAGAYDAGALNEQVWKAYVKKGAPELEQVRLIWTSPPFHDYHWVLHPAVAKRYGADFPDKIRAALLKLDASNPEHKAILELFGATRFVPTDDTNYGQIEAVGKQVGLIVDNTR